MSSKDLAHVRDEDFKGLQGVDVVVTWSGQVDDTLDISDITSDTPAQLGKVITELTERIGRGEADGFRGADARATLYRPDGEPNLHVPFISAPRLQDVQDLVEELTTFQTMWAQA
ncbi:hypothetical protein [Longispora albida]|uniref:hypothetical protein n=1 Tax=Longispora albida TaxID=203523 RepID=UPI000377D9CD|nr:hypothetical protein [Longispora albida]